MILGSECKLNLKRNGRIESNIKNQQHYPKPH